MTVEERALCELCEDLILDRGHGFQNVGRP